MLSVAVSTFRDRKVAAPLKRDRSRGPRLYLGPFRDRKVAAPLKALILLPFKFADDSLPRPKGRGPIEGRANLITRVKFGAFRDRKVAAPLKDPGLAAPCNGRQPLPRPKGRGPIEG